MNNPDSSITFHKRLTAMRVIHGALLSGAVVFFVVVLVVLPLPAPPLLQVVSFMGIGFAVFGTLASWLIPGFLAAQWRHKMVRGLNPLPSIPRPGYTQPALGNEDHWLILYQMRLIIALALLEGPLFFLLVAYTSEAMELTLVFAAALWTLMLVRFPTESGVRHWIESQQELLDTEKRLTA